MKISIITPSLNQGKFIEETIKSVIYQEGDFELEYVIMDGGSNDNTLEIVKEYDKLLKSKKFKPRCKRLIFKWFSGKDMGQSHAINKGFKLAKGEIVNWLCSDDLLEKGALQIVSDFFKKQKDVKIMFGDSFKIDERSRKTGYFRGGEFTREELIRRWDRVYWSFFITQPSVFFKKCLLEEFGYLNEENDLCMDYEWWLKVNKKYKFYYTGKTLAQCRMHKSTKSERFKEKQFKDAIQISRKYWKENYLKYAFSWYFFILIKRPVGRLLKKIKLYNFAARFLRLEY